MVQHGDGNGLNNHVRRTPPHQPHLGISRKGGSPVAGWKCSWKIPLKRMMTPGVPSSGWWLNHPLKIVRKSGFFPMTKSEMFQTTNQLLNMHGIPENASTLNRLNMALQRFPPPHNPASGVALWLPVPVVPSRCGSLPMPAPRPPSTRETERPPAAACIGRLPGDTGDTGDTGISKLTVKDVHNLTMDLMVSHFHNLDDL